MPSVHYRPMFAFLSNDQQKPQLKIAIIGGGIGGTSCAYFLRSLFGDSVGLDLYEAENIGGRLSVVSFGGKNYEVGGSIIHSRNKYMTKFLNLFKLTKRDSSRDSYFGLYNGNEFVFEESTWQIVTLYRMIRRYHFGFWKLKNHINDMLDKFDKIYKYQDKGVTFQNVSTLLSAMDPTFAESLHITSEAGFEKEGLSKVVIDELVMATLRTNYGQDLKAHKFVGSVSVAGAGGGLWAFHGGNSQVPEKLLHLAQAQLTQCMVTTVKKLPSNEIEVIVESECSKTSNTYDIVIIAAPQTSDMKHKINFVDFRKPINFPGKYHQTVCTLIKGKLRDEYFPNKKKYIDGVLTINDSKFFNSIGRIYPVDYKQKNSEVSDVWKVFSQKLLSDSQLDSIFSEINDKYVKVWLAYPEYDTSDRYDSFVLDDNLYHINAIDWAASSMEMSVIGARNVALLIHKNWQQSSSSDSTWSDASSLGTKDEF
ncbi:UNVERIFIED_CONTAM: hypothetical protein PYX00_000533 [Menopon gallinae]|uniref:Prenylcysteine lyase domain-containing protein n=1 Tax=Menopon gallinae TaxID=328185 RepID=A0AAW2IAS0_9NEOP